MQSNVITFYVHGFRQGPAWKYRKDIEKVGRKALLRALEIEEK